MRFIVRPNVHMHRKDSTMKNSTRLIVTFAVEHLVDQRDAVATSIERDVAEFIQLLAPIHEHAEVDAIRISLGSVGFASRISDSEILLTSTGIKFRNGFSCSLEKRTVGELWRIRAELDSAMIEFAQAIRGIGNA